MFDSFLLLPSDLFIISCTCPLVMSLYFTLCDSIKFFISFALFLYSPQFCSLFNNPLLSLTLASSRNTLSFT
ncbi:hypothetical protein BJ742DRAFT_801628 [Cladochytrium replicatum]|nr:hypothetical protein BJ742DRAFT_801628 [Cladochytrium replicatum]